MAARDWSGLPVCVLGLILCRLPIPDYLRCRAVCRTWRLAVVETPHRPSKPQLPWLMIPRQLDNGIEHCYRYFYSLSEKRFYHLHLPFLRFLRCIGSSNGWFVMVDPVHQLHLLNPITGAHRRLPPVTTFEDIIGIVRGPDGHVTGYTCRLNGGSEFFSTLDDMSRYYSKVFVFSTTVFVIHSSARCLSYARPGDESWTLIRIRNGDYEGMPPSQLNDLVEYKGKFYGVSYAGVVLVIDTLTSPTHKSRFLPPTWTCVRPWPDNFGWIYRYYLVESADGEDLLLVWRCFSEKQSESIFMVFRLLDPQASCPEWVRVENLGECTLLVGENSISLAISTEEAPLELRGNCIYFTEVKRSQPRELVPRDAGIFHLGDETITPCYDIQFIFQLDRFNWTPHLWFSPTLSLVN